jgi:PAS domain S-box-containing protein
MAGERDATQHEVRRSREHLDMALSAAELGTWDWDLGSGRVTWDGRTEAIFGFEPGAFGGTFLDFRSRLHPDDAEQMIEAVDAAVASAGRHHTEHRIVRPDGTVRWVEGHGRAVTDDDGTVTGMVGVVADVTERKMAEDEIRRAHEEAEEARRRLAFLADASVRLASSLDYDKTLATFADIVVPAIADWCSVDLIDERSRLRRVALVHADPAKSELARNVESDAPDPTGSSPIWDVLKTGRSLLVREVTDDVLVAASASEEELDLLRKFGFRSGMVVALATRGRVLGAITFVVAESGRRYDDADLALAEQLAARAAMAADNARLFSERSYVARKLQESLLPRRLPEVPGLSIAARYVAAGEGSEVGGDFYDVFETADGHWSLMIGDVCGQGADAAGVTAIARHTARAIAAAMATPSETLRRLNHAILVQNESDERFFTMAKVRVEPTDAGVQITVACAGHPLPAVVRGDGAIGTIGRPGTVLGLFPEIELTDETTSLQPGDTLVLYTDGVIEARQGVEQFGEERLFATLRDAAALDADGIAASVVDAVFAYQERPGDDDVAVLVAKATG